MKLGKTQTLWIQRITSVGAYLNEVQSGVGKKESDVLLPKKYLRPEMKPGDRIKVFVSLDSEDRMIATTKQPRIEVGEFALLEVVDVTRIGAFLNWGLEKDLFLPFEEQLHRVKPRERVLVCCYIDKSGRIAATMKVKNRFAVPKGLKENDAVEGLVYSTNPEIGAFVLINKRYNALLPKAQMRGALAIGQTIEARIAFIKPDGKIDLSLVKRAHEQLEGDASLIYGILKANRGFLRVNDHTSPAAIKTLFGMSKAQFKRAVGNLLKRRMIQFENDGIKVVKGDRNDRKTRS